jgi:hypothetical protein
VAVCGAEWRAARQGERGRLERSDGARRALDGSVGELAWRLVHKASDVNGRRAGGVSRHWNGARAASEGTRTAVARHSGGWRELEQARAGASRRGGRGRSWVSGA